MNKNLCAKPRKIQASDCKTIAICDANKNFENYPKIMEHKSIGREVLVSTYLKKVLLKKRIHKYIFFIVVGSRVSSHDVTVCGDDELMKFDGQGR